MDTQTVAEPTTQSDGARSALVQESAPEWESLPDRMVERWELLSLLKVKSKTLTAMIARGQVPAAYVRRGTRNAQWRASTIRQLGYLVPIEAPTVRPEPDKASVE